MNRIITKSVFDRVCCLTAIEMLKILRNNLNLPDNANQKMKVKTGDDIWEQAFKEYDTQKDMNKHA